MCPMPLADSMKPTKINKITQRIILTVIHSMLFFNVSSDAGVFFPPVGILNKKNIHFS